SGRRRYPGAPGWRRMSRGGGRRWQSPRGRSCCAVLAAGGVEADGDVEVLDAAHHVEGKGLVVGEGVEGGEEVVGGAQVAAVGRGQEVAFPEAGGLGGAALFDDPNEDAVAFR